LHQYEKREEEEVVYVSSESDEDEKLYKQMSKVRLDEGKPGMVVSRIPYIDY